MPSQRQGSDAVKEATKEGKETKEAKAVARETAKDAPREGLMNLAELTDRTIPELTTIARSVGLVG
ncbi:MAG: hypothetical protein L0Y78_05005, partial [candidate division NC10 bacterium]|nr:hypothetical protein [candidate division NC10 bacterium]